MFAYVRIMNMQINIDIMLINWHFCVIYEQKKKVYLSISVIAMNTLEWNLNKLNVRVEINSHFPFTYFEYLPACVIYLPPLLGYQVSPFIAANISKLPFLFHFITN